jgi:hypothetical protein
MLLLTNGLRAVEIRFFLFSDKDLITPCYIQAD